MSSAEDVQTNRCLQKLLLERQVDLRYVEFHTTRGTVTLKGVIRSNNAADHRVDAEFLADLERQTRALPHVQTVDMQFRHWRKEGEDWRCDDGGTDERRDGTRIALRVPMYWRQEHGSGGKPIAFHHTETLSVGTLGVCFRCGYCTEKVGGETDGRSKRCKLHEFHADNPRGRSLPITIDLPDGTRIDANAKVLHVNHLPRSGDECVGAKFHGLPKEDREKLRQFIESQQAAPGA